MKPLLRKTDESIANFISVMEELKGEFAPRDEVIQRIEGELENWKKRAGKDKPTGVIAQNQFLSQAEWESAASQWEERFKKAEEEISNLESYLGSYSRTAISRFRKIEGNFRNPK